MSYLRLMRPFAEKKMEAGLLDRAKKSGALAAEVEAMDLRCAIAGVATFGTEEGWESSAKRLVKVIGLGLRSSR
jgi:hypothetical protein